MWELAEQNADVLRFSTIITADQVERYLADPAGVEEAIAWCRDHGMTHVYLESFRGEVIPPKQMLAAARERFRDAGFLVSGCMTPSRFGKQGTGWPPFSCFTAQETRQKLRAMSEYAAGLFDVVMIDDFLCFDCTCPECRAARGGRSWARYKCETMLELSRTHIIEPGRAVNPKVEFIIKYPAWYEMYQERGYDAAAQSALFPRTWAGTETRGYDPGEAPEGRKPHHTGDPHYQAFWLLRWLKDIGGGKCGGGWYDPYDTGPSHYLEQARQTVLGDPGEIVLFSFGLLREGIPGRCPDGPRDLAALMDEMPLHFELARLVYGKEPRGLLGWKPPNSMPGPDERLHPLLGMAGFPVTAAHRFDPAAPGFVFGYQVLDDPAWWDAVEAAMASGRPILATPAFLDTIRPMAEGNRLDLAGLRERAIVPPRITDSRRWRAVAELPPDELDAMRDRACSALGVRFHAPFGVSLHLFDDDLAVVENFRNEPAPCSLEVEGWRGAEAALRIPAGGAFEVAGDSGAFTLPPRSLLAVRRA